MLRNSFLMLRVTNVRIYIQKGNKMDNNFLALYEIDKENEKEKKYHKYFSLEEDQEEENFIPDIMEQLPKEFILNTIYHFRDDIQKSNTDIQKNVLKRLMRKNCNPALYCDRCYVFNKNNALELIRFF